MSKTVSLLLFVAAAGFGYAAWSLHEARAARSDLASANRSLAALQSRHDSALAELLTAEHRAEAVERDNATLSAAIEKAAAAKRATQRSATAFAPETLPGHIKEAQSLADKGDPEGAMKLLLACYDEGLPQLGAQERQRQVGRIARALAALAGTYPPATAALRQRFEAARDRLLAGDDGSSIQELAATAQALKDPAALVNVYDQLPQETRARKHLAIYAFEDLVAARRYTDALFGRDAASMVAQFEMNTGRALPESMPNRERFASMTRAYAIRAAVTNVECLAGAGQLDAARSLATRLLNYDGSPETQAQLKAHLDRAGHPDLLARAAP